MEELQNNSYYIKEKNIGISPIISKEQNKMIINQLGKFICKIIVKNEIKGSGFISFS